MSRQSRAHDRPALAGYLREVGYQLREYPLDQWAAIIREHAGNAAAPALDVFLVEMTGDGWSQVQLGTAATTRALGDAFSACPPLTSGLFGTYLRYFTQTGYLPAPLWLAPVAGPGHRGSGHASQREAS